MGFYTPKFTGVRVFFTSRRSLQRALTLLFRKLRRLTQEGDLL